MSLATLKGNLDGEQAGRVPRPSNNVQLTAPPFRQNSRWLQLANERLTPRVKYTRSNRGMTGNPNHA